MKNSTKSKIKALIKSPNANESAIAKKFNDRYSKPVRHSYKNALEPSEEKELIDAIDEHNSPNRLHHKALIYLMKEAGLRIEEALQFRREWFVKKDDCYLVIIPFEDKDITNLRKTWRPKTKKGIREIPIYNKEVTSFLDVFLQTNKRIKLNRQNGWKRVKYYGAKIGKPNLHPHALRSTFLNKLVNLNVNLATLKNLAGWVKLETANKYISGTPQSARNDYKRKLEQ